MAFTPVGVEFVGKGLSQYLKGLGQADKAQQGLANSASNIGSSFSKLGSNVLGFGANLAKVAAGGVAALGAGLVAAGAVSVKTAISFESAFAGVEKTVDGLDKVVDGLGTTLGDKLKGSLVEISKVTPTTFEQLAAIGELGGQLGIRYSETDDSLVKFTETIAQLGVATSLSEEEAATSLARISNIFEQTGELAGDNIRSLGNTIVELGNNFATTEPEIVSFATRIAGAGKIAGLSQADILAIGTAFSSVGVQAEAGGTAVQKVLLAMNGAVNATSDGFVDNSKQIDNNVARLTKLNAESARLEAQFPGLQAEILAQRDAFIASGGSAEDFGRQLGDKTRQSAFETASAIQDLTAETELLRAQQGQPIDPGQLTKFAQVAGVTADEFSELWQTDAAGAFQLFVEGLAREGDNAESVLRDLNLTDQRLIRSFLSLSEAGGLLGETIETANKEWEDGNALQTEADKRFATTESRIAIFKNTLRAFANEIGSRLLPVVNKLIDSGIEFVEKWAGPIEDALDNIILPAIENFVSLIGDLFAAFQVGSVAGLADSLGITPEINELLDKIVTSVTSLGQAILSFLLPGLESISGGGLLDGINAAISFANENFEILKGALIGIGAVIAGGVIVALVAGLFSLLTPINLIIAAAALLGAAWAGNWFGIQETTQQVIAVILTAFEVLKAIFASIVAVLAPTFESLGESLSSFGINWTTVFNAILTATQIVIASIGAILLAIVAVVVGVVAAIASALDVGIAAFTNLLVFIEQALTGIGQLLIAFVEVWSGIFTGDIPRILEGFKLGFTGLGNFIEGIFGGIITIVIGGLATILAAIGTFISSVIEFFTTLSDTLVGNSIIPDMVMAIIDWFTSLVEPILSVFSTIGESIGAILGGLFGGGGEAGVSIDPAQFEAVQLAIDNINLSITEIIDSTIPALSAAITALATLVTPLWAALNTLITMTNQLLIDMYTIHLVTVQATTEALMSTVFPLWEELNTLITFTNQLLIDMYSIHLPGVQVATITTANVIVKGFTAANEILQKTIELLTQIIEKLGEVASAADEVANALKDIGDGNEALEDMIDLLDKATSFANDLASALSSVASANGGVAGALAGIGFSGGTSAAMGLGFRSGTLGYTVPPGFPNDTFPIRVTSGEEVLVAPPSSSIDEIVAGAFGVGGGKMITVNVGPVTSNMDLAIVTEQIKRVVAEETN